MLSQWWGLTHSRLSWREELTCGGWALLGLCQDRCCSAALQSGLLKGSGFRLNLPVGIGWELLLMQILPALQFDCSPASSCGGTTGVWEEKEWPAVCGLGMEGPAGVGVSQTTLCWSQSLIQQGYHGVFYLEASCLGEWTVLKGWFLEEHLCVCSVISICPRCMWAQSSQLFGENVPPRVLGPVCM